MTDKSLAGLLTDIASDAAKLLRQELSLAQAEVTEKLQQAQIGLLSVLTGLLVALSALIILLQALVLALATVMPAWMASVLVGGTMAIVALVLLRLGQNKLAAKNLIPARSLRSVQNDKDMAMETLQ
jgi:Putative Actinobacterial Holin-X, holin superfamily III